MAFFVTFHRDLFAVRIQILIVQLCLRRFGKTVVNVFLESGVIQRVQFRLIGEIRIVIRRKRPVRPFLSRLRIIVSLDCGLIIRISIGRRMQGTIDDRRFDLTWIDSAVRRVCVDDGLILFVCGSALGDIRHQSQRLQDLGAAFIGSCQRELVFRTAFFPADKKPLVGRVKRSIDPRILHLIDHIRDRIERLISVPLTLIVPVSPSARPYPLPLLSVRLSSFVVFSALLPSFVFSVPPVRYPVAASCLTTSFCVPLTALLAAFTVAFVVSETVVFFKLYAEE